MVKTLGSGFKVSGFGLKAVEDLGDNHMQRVELPETGICSLHFRPLWFLGQPGSELVASLQP